MANGSLLGSGPRRLGLSAVLAAVLSCAPGASAHEGQARGPAGGGRVFHCTSAGPSAGSYRARTAGDRQILRGETRIQASARSGARLNLVETAAFDARGRLLSARIVAAPPRDAQTTFVLDAAAGRVRVLRTGAAPLDWRVPTDAPWIYAPATSAGGLLAATPVAGWIAARAAALGPVVRVVRPERRDSYLAPIDQVAVAMGGGAVTVVLADDGVDVGRDFVTEARLSARAVSLSCAEEVSLAAR